MKYDLKWSLKVTKGHLKISQLQPGLTFFGQFLSLFTYKLLQSGKKLIKGNNTSRFIELN